MHLHANILLIRKLLAETQGDFAQRFTGVTLGMQKSYERRKNPIPPSNLYVQELAALSGVTQEMLQNKLLSKEAITFRKVKVKKVNTDQVSASQLIDMFLEVSKRQTAQQESQARIETNLADLLAIAEKLSDIQNKTVVRMLKELAALRSAPMPLVKAKGTRKTGNGGGV